ncbi:MAG: hypothetical protein JWP75_2951 [Frondihabitans sp.]|nr:hypothetical protein [Frondihabitans sp.]
MHLRSLSIPLALPVVLLAPLVAVPANAAEQTQLIGSGWTDPSTLEVVDWVDPGAEKEPPPRHPDPISVPARTVAATCSGRKDFYRVIDWNGKTFCFSNKGEIYPNSIYSAKYLCPGNNVGSSYYRQRSNGSYQWSLWRDGHSNWNQCYQFSGPSPAPEVVGVRIK